MTTSRQQGTDTSTANDPYRIVGNGDAEPSLSTSSYTSTLSTQSDPGPVSDSQSNGYIKRPRSRSTGEEKETDIEEAKLEKMVVIEPVSPETKGAVNDIQKKVNHLLAWIHEQFRASKQYQGLLRIYQEKKKSAEQLDEDLKFTYEHILGEVVEVLTWMKLKNNPTDWTMLYYSGELYNAISYAAVNLASKIGCDNGHSAHQRKPQLKNGLFDVAPFDALQMRKGDKGKIEYVLSSRDALAKASVDPLVTTAYVPICYGTKKAVDDNGLKTVRSILRTYLETGANVVLYFGPFGDVQVPIKERNDTGVRHRAAWLLDHYAAIVNLEKEIQSAAKKAKNSKKVGTFSILYGHSCQLPRRKEVVGLYEGEAYQKTYLDFYSYLFKNNELLDPFYQHIANDVVKYLCHGKYPEYKEKPVKNVVPTPGTPEVRNDLFEMVVNRLLDALIQNPSNRELADRLFELLSKFDDRRKKGQSSPPLSSSAVIQESLSREPSPVTPMLAQGGQQLQNEVMQPPLLTHSQHNVQQRPASPSSFSKQSPFFNGRHNSSVGGRRPSTNVVPMSPATSPRQNG